jgi:hypothetical protein
MATSAASLIPATLRKKLVGVALASPEFKAALSDAAAEIRTCAKSRSSEATIEGCFERVLYALLRGIGVKIHPEKEVHVNLRRHLAKGRMDSRIGAVVIEYKRPSLLQTPGQVESALTQLEDYLVPISAGNTTQFVGLLTNGLRIFEIRARGGVIMARLAGVQVDAAALDRVARLLTALEQTALTAENLIRDFCGSEADGVLFRTARILDGILAKTPHPKTLMLKSEWEEMFRLSHDDLSQQKRIEERRSALASIFGLGQMTASTEYRTLFALQTAYAIVLKFIAFRVVSDVYLGKMEPEFKSLAGSTASALRMFCSRLEDGEVFRDLGILNLLEGDFFSWYSDPQQWTDDSARCVRELLEVLARYEDAASVFSSERAHDLFRGLYQAAMPRALRSSLGEFYTPYWLAEHVLSSAIISDNWRAIDPCSGSGTFIVAAIARLRQERGDALSPSELVAEILERIAAIDLNPISVLMTRIHYFLHISDLLRSCERVSPFVIPVYLGDAASMPERVEIDGVECLRYQLRTLRSPIDTSLPVSLVSDTTRFMLDMVAYEQHIKADDEQAAVRVLEQAIPASSRTPGVMAEINHVTRQLIDLERNGWDGIWARILSNFMTTACIGRFTAVVGNPPWIDWRNLPAGYRERIKRLCIERGLFSGDRRTGGINLNICALIAYTSLVNWLDDSGRLAFLMPRELINQPSYEGWRRLGDRGYQFLTFYDWTRAGHPFDPIREDFLTFVLDKQEGSKNKNVPFLAMERIKGDASRPSKWKDAGEAERHLTVVPKVAAQVIPGRTAFTVADTQSEMDRFALIAGECEYVGRQGVEFYPQELLLFTFDSLGPEEGTVFLRNVQVAEAKYKQPARCILLETAYLFPLVKGTAIEPFQHNDQELLVAFPYEASDPQTPVPKSVLRFRSPRLFRYYDGVREVLAAQSKYTDKLRGKGSEFYSVARTGPYTFRETYVAFRDNTRWCATVITDADTPWGERKRFIFQKHAGSMCERIDGSGYIDLEEAHYICAILNTPIVERFIYASSDERSFKIRPPVLVPRYDASHPVHQALAAASKQAHGNPDDATALLKKTEEWYLQLCRERWKARKASVPKAIQEPPNR